MNNEPIGKSEFKKNKDYIEQFARNICYPNSLLLNKVNVYNNLNKDDAVFHEFEIIKIDDFSDDVIFKILTNNFIDTYMKIYSKANIIYQAECRICYGIDINKKEELISNLKVEMIKHFKDLMIHKGINDLIINKIIINK